MEKNSILEKLESFNEQLNLSYYWNNKLLYLTANKLYSGDFERNFQNAVILSKNNSDIKLALRLFYLRNIPRFSNETRLLVISK